jgi:hypothetical protein
LQILLLKIKKVKIMDKKNAIIVILFIAILGLSYLAFHEYNNSSQNIMSGQHNILLLCADPSEPRPGIGAVDMAFIISLNNGNIANVTRIYPHAMAHPTATPPASLKAQGVSQWLLHDALWDADAEKGAKLAQEIVEYNTGQKTDMVLIMTPEAVDAMIQSIGPIYVEGQGYVNGSSLQFIREESTVGVDRGIAIELLMKSMSNATQNKSKYLTMIQAGITQYNQGNILVFPKGAFVQFLISAGIKGVT